MLSVNKRYHYELKAAEEADERDRKRQKQTLHGGNLVPMVQQLQLKQVGVDFAPLGRNPEPDLLYINCQVPGGTNALNALPTLCLFDRNYDKVLLPKPSDYHMAVVRAQVPIASAPIFYSPTDNKNYVWVSYIDVGDPSTAVNQAIHWAAVGAGTATQVVPTSINANYDLQPGQNPFYASGATAIMDIQQFLTAVNDAIARATRACLAFSSPFSPHRIPYGSTGMFPEIAYDQTSQLFSVSFEQQAWYGGPDPIHRMGQPNFPANFAGSTVAAAYPLGTMCLFMSKELYNTYFPTIPAEWLNTWKAGQVTSSVPTTVADGVLLRLNPYYGTSPSPGGGPQQSLRSTPDPGFVTFQTWPVINGGDGLVHLFWYNPSIPHGVRPGMVDFSASTPVTYLPGDVVVVTGGPESENLNGVYQVQLIGQNNPSFGANLVFPYYQNPTLPASGFNPPGNATWWMSTPLTHAVAGPFTDSGIMMVASQGSMLPGQNSTMWTTTPCMSGWNGIVNIRLVTYNLPVRNELYPANPTTLFSPPGNEIMEKRTILECSPTNLGADVLFTKDSVLFESNDHYRWIELMSEEPLRRWSVQALWVDLYGNEFPLYVSPADSFEVKILMRRKYIST